MKISYSWLQQFIDLPETPETIAEILTAIGLEVESWEEVCSVKGALEGLRIGEVLECEKHSNADKLRVTQVNLGDGNTYQIVCGAPNVAKGQKVIVAPVGAWVHPSEGEKFQIKSAKIRGEKSEGMICAEDEIGLGKGHDGIMILPADAPLGLLAAEYFKVKKDVVFEIGLTPNRSDAQCHKGVAEDLAAYFNFHFNENRKIKVHSSEIKSTISNPFAIQIETEKCTRYCGVYIQNVEVKPSPEWLRSLLATIGLKSINNIVDITNYILHSYGQPLHAFDADFIAGNSVRIKHLPDNTSFHALDEKNYVLKADDVIICDKDAQPLCIAGIYGGYNSGVKETTKNIFLESAVFDSVAVRKTASRLLLRTDAAQRFEKGIDVLQTKDIAFLAAQMIVETCENASMSDVVDVVNKMSEPANIDLRFEKVSATTGLNINKDDIKRLLKALHFQIIEENADSLKLLQPSNKIDVTREIDVIEELLRIYGLDKVEIPSELQSAINWSDKLKKEFYVHKISERLCGFGFNEIMTNSMSQKKYYEKFEHDVLSNLVMPMNSVNANIDCMRAGMLYSGLEVIAYNQNRKNSDLKLYEWGKTFTKNGESFVETEFLAILICGKKYTEHWKNTTKDNVDYFDLKSNIKAALSTTGITFSFEKIAEDSVLQYGEQLISQRNSIGKMGLVHAEVLKYFGIHEKVFYAEIRVEDLLKSASKNVLAYKALSKFQDVKRDLAIVLDKQIEYSKIEQIARKVCGAELQYVGLFDVFEDEKKLGEGKKSYAVNFVFSNPAKTYNDNEIDSMMNALKEKLQKELDAQIRA